MERNKKMADVKKELEKRTVGCGSQSQSVKLTKNMTIVDMVKALEPEIKRALPAVLTPKRFTRMALSAINNTPKLAECTPMSFIAALMNAAQLGLEPNTALGQAYLIPYKNKGVLECQFQIGYRGMIDLAYRNERVQSIEAQTVYENDIFEYELGLMPKLIHKPVFDEPGAIRAFYAIFKLDNGGFRFEIMSKTSIDAYAAKYSKAFSSEFSPWKSNYEGMSKKTVIKQLLKYAPMKSDFQKAVSMDETIKAELSVDMSEVQNREVIEGEFTEQAA
jgi:recombination protein RecT